MTKPIRRVVTTHDAHGRSIVHSDDQVTPSAIPTGDADMALIWTTQTVPADNTADLAGAARPAGVTLHGGSVIRIVDMLPQGCSPMHRSHSIDYGIVLSGELEMDLDGGETVRLGPGDIVVQRGTNHLWRNPSHTDPCRIAFILIEAAPVHVAGNTLPESFQHPDER